MTNQIEINDVAKETVCVLNYFNPEFNSKIPEKIINTLKELSKESTAIVNIDKRKRLVEQEILEETKDLVSLIYYSYIATKEEK